MRRTIASGNSQYVEFCTSVDCAFLAQFQEHVAQLSCAVLDSATRIEIELPECQYHYPNKTNLLNRGLL